MISNQNNPNEPSIMFNPENPNQMVAAANINNVYRSSDAGISWEQIAISSSYGIWGDPVIDVDSDGNFYFFHLSNPSNGHWIDRIVAQKSTDAGATWNNGSYMGLSGNKNQDKQWSVIDPNNGNIYVTWTQFDVYGSASPDDFSNILFSKSTDGGESWSAPVQINRISGDCVDEDDTVEGAVPALGPNGEIYVSWAGPNGLVFSKSLDQGATWSSEEVQVAEIPGGWDFAVPGIYRANGLPITKCDLSGGENHGTIYVNWSDQRNGTSDTDIWLVKSTDGGDTWTEPIRVNDDNSNKHQFFTWMDVDSTNGKLYFVFYDRRNHTGNYTDVYLAISDDGGLSFENIKISESPFLPNSNIFFGDYTNIVAHNDMIRPIWTRLHNGELSVWTDVTPIENLKNTNPIYQDNQVYNYPNPSHTEAYISFKLHERSIVNLDLFSSTGQLIQNVLDKETFDYGKHIIPIHIEKLGMKKGIYYGKLKINQVEKTVKIIAE